MAKITALLIVLAMCGITGAVIAASGGGASPGNASNDQYKPPKCKKGEEPDGHGHCKKKKPKPPKCKKGETVKNGKCVKHKHTVKCKPGSVQKNGHCVKNTPRQPKCRRGHVWKKGHGGKPGHCVKKHKHKHHGSNWEDGR